MSAKRILWATNRPDGTPLLVRGVLADIDDETHQVTISERAAEIVEEVLAQEPLPTEIFAIPGIDLAPEVHRLVQAKHKAGVAVRDPLPPPAVREEDEQQQAPASGTEEIVDQMLLRLHRQAARLGHLLGERPSAVSLTDLRRSPLGRDLILLSRVAGGEEHVDAEKVFRTASALLDLLFGTLGEDPYRVPRTFWEEPLGQMLSRAKLHVVDVSDLVSIGNAAQRLGINRQVIDQWIDDGTLDSIHDPANNLMYLRRQDVEQLHESNLLKASVG